MLTDEERKLISFAAACYVDDALVEGKKRKVKNPEYYSQLAQIQRINYTKLNPEALCGDLVLADGTTLKKI